MEKFVVSIFGIIGFVKIVIVCIVVSFEIKKVV